MRDFSLEIFRRLCNELHNSGYTFQTFQEYLESPGKKVVIMRHDIDVDARRALPIALLESSLGIKASFYFRAKRYCFNPKVISQIVGLGHEIGYHYEDLARNNGDIASAIDDFTLHLAKFRRYYQVRTVCMHGSSGSVFDNRDIWKSAKLADFDLIGEPYLSLDFSKLLYLTDTTQKWNGSKVSVRDKVESSYKYDFTTTFDIINNIDALPLNIMLTTHPELWTSTMLGWAVTKSIFFLHSNYKLLYRNKRVNKRN